MRRRGRPESGMLGVQRHMNEIVGRLATGEAVRVVIDGPRIAEVVAAATTPEVVVAPGLVDVQVNGYRGFDVNELPLRAATIHALTRSLWRHGVTGLCPTLISAGADAIVDGLRAVADACREDPRTAHTVAGVHIEGPYLSPVDGARGAHRRELLRDPSLTELRHWLAAAPGLLRIVTLAPERDGALEFVGELAAHHIVPAIGHSMATAGQVRAAVARGAVLATHLGNGIPGTIPRHENIVWPLLAADSVTASFIADGHHLPAEMLTAMVRAKGIGRSLLVSDSAALAGLPAGTYATPVGGTVTVQPDGRIVLTGTPYLAGAGSALDECVAWTVSHTPLPLAAALAMASSTPAALIGRPAALRAGEPADLVLWQRVEGAWQVQQTILAGETVFRRGASDEGGVTA